MAWQGYDSDGNPIAGSAGGVTTVPEGGTGVSTVTAGALLLGDGTDPLVELVGANEGDIVVWDDTASAWEARSGVPAFVLLNSEVTQNTAQPTYTAGTANDITPTEKVDTGNHCSVSGAVITLAAGTWEFHGNMILVSAGGNWGAWMEIWNNTASSRIQRGHAGTVASGARYNVNVSGQFTLSAATDIKWRVYVDGANSNAAGALNVASEDEVYGQLVLFKRA